MYFLHITILKASVVELVDATDSKSVVLRDVPVQVRPGAPLFTDKNFVVNKLLMICI